MVDSSEFAKKGDDLRLKAEATLKGSFFGNLMKGKQDRADEALELYQQAANCYKHAQDPAQAVECYLKCVEC